ncbi:MAG: ADP-ribosylglycohydrolase family protein [Planctomycetaceae bacterium]|nr:ADP-ribosylglycohydrolase family protein [Planctomycetaceae bacterium]
MSLSETAVRRRTLVSSAAMLLSNVRAAATHNRTPASTDRIEGMLLGGLVGDALGGPVEFHSDPRSLKLCQARAWDDQPLTDERLQELSSSLVLLPYAGIRDAVAPYGPWQKSAPAGTLTDDSRHKIVLLRAIRSLLDRSADAPASQAGVAVRLKKSDIAHQLIDFQARPAGGDSAQIQELNEEGFREYRLASRWLLGERDPGLALPVERLWGGVNNCSGQMMFPPLAACFAGRPEDAYKAAWDLDFIDAPAARDMLAALVAGLAEILHSRYDSMSPEQKLAALRQTMESTDPYRQAKIPFAGRQLNKWLRLSDGLVERAQGSPQRLYRLLEDEGKPVYWWDAHFTLLVPLTILQLCRLQPLAALHLTLDFGHDTDSYAQVLGCLVGAIYGASVFPAAMQKAVCATLKLDYQEDVSQWLITLRDYARRCDGTP